MKLVKTITAAALLGMASWAGASPIAPGTYDLFDHPDGGARPPSYGIRLDGLTTGNASDIHTYEFISMTMTYDGAGILAIAGQVFGGLNDDMDGYVDAQFWDVVFAYTDAEDCAEGLCANNGFGTISMGDLVFDLVAYAGSHSAAFYLGFDHRGFAGVSGWGWLNHCVADGTVSDGVESCDNPHLASSDWLFTVPEPGTLLLLGVGLLGTALTRRRRV